ncbi:MAG: arginine--tRNA ligase [Clostridia bacterium]|nr:arginine--tRNA ligase [Clostridia bacterium]
MLNYKQELAKKISEITNIDTSELISYIEIPPNPSLGDYSFPCFRLAKEMKKAPPVIANEIKEQMLDEDWIEKIDVVGGYLNIFTNKKILVENVLGEVISKQEDYGKSDVGNGKTVVIDYSAPNIAKPFHIGHLRSTVIGGALYKMYQFLGYKVIGINHLGDWGMGICRTMAGYRMWKDEYDFTENPINSVLAIYVRYNKIEKEDPDFKKYAVEELKKLEAGDEETVALWKWIIKISLEDYQKIYDLIGCKFDSYNGEAFYNDKMDRVVKELEEKHLLVESEGAKVVMMDENIPPCIILTSAGTTIYATRDLAALLYRIDTYDFDKCLYLVASEQSLHFKQVFEVLSKMGYKKYADRCEHIPFGLVLDEDGEKMGSRKGNAVTLSEIFNEAIEKSLKIIEEKNPDLEEKEEVAKMVGVGAIIFNDLANNRIKDEIFDWNQVLNFAGETGPYMQYTYVRTQSILRNAGYVPENADYSKLLDSEAIDVVKQLANFTDTVKSGVEKNEPSILSRYLIDLAQSFSRFYNEHHILCDDKDTQDARLALTEAVGIVIKSGLELLGIRCPVKM